MTRLLVSVRDVAEARVALDGGVDLLDLKEPTRGPLGAVATSIVTEVVSLAAARAPVSMALGELLDLPSNVDSSLAVSRGLRYVKVGLARCATHPGWLAKFVALVKSLSTETSLVAVVYADAGRVAAPGVDEVLEAAAMAGCRVVLVDTAIKDGRGLLDHWPVAAVRGFIGELRGRGFTSVLGGSLNLATIAEVAECGADYVAVRGAVCRGDRTATIDAEKLRQVREALAPFSAAKSNASAEPIVGYRRA